MMNENYNGVEPQKTAPKATTESAESLDSKSESRASLHQPTDGDVGQVKFTKNTDDAAVEIGTVDVAFAGMGKEELMKFANDPFWVRLRWTVFILFWLGWLGMLVAAIVIVVLAPKCPPPAPLEYWQKGVVYSVNVKSFQDSGANQDGKGDLKGVTGRLDHFVHLGVNMIALSSIYKTANDEALYGQDIVNFIDINPTFGTVDDLKDLTTAAKEKDLKILLDIVPNHSSKQHPWFVESRKGTSGEYADYYVWRDPVNNGVPNNWTTLFGTPAWTLDPSRNQYYYHIYGPEQPDLNLRNSVVREEIKSILRFWLNQGISGFRLLSAPYLFENNMGGGGRKLEGQQNIDETFNFIGEIRAFLAGDADAEKRVLLVETDDLPTDAVVRYYGTQEAPLADLSVNSLLADPNTESLTGTGLRDMIESYLREVDWAWPNWVLGNADQRRVASRLGASLIDGISMIQLLLPGTPITYYGDDIAMEDVNPRSDKCQKMNKLDSTFNCNQARSPFQWDETPIKAGFTNASAPWYPVGNNLETINAKSQLNSSTSHLNIYRELTNLRKQPAVMFGNTSVVDSVVTDSIFAFTRIRKGAPGYLVILNLGVLEETLDFSSEKSISEEAQAVLRSSTATNNSTIKGSKIDTSKVPIGPKEGLVLSFVPKF